MKKIFFAAFALLSSFALISCDEDYTEGILPPQTSDPEAPQTVAFGDGAVTELTTINLADVTEDMVQVCQITAPTVTDENASLTGYTLTIGENVLEITEDGKVSLEEITKIVEGLYGKRPVERELVGVVRCYYSSNGQNIVTVSDPITIKLVPKAPIIADNYYLIGATLDWKESAINKSQKFNHSDKDVYEDPIFTIVVPASEGETWFAIGDDAACEAIANDDWSKLLGTTAGNGKNELTGNLDFRYNLSDEGSLMVPAGNKLIKVTLNMMDYTFTIEPVNISENYYLIGGPGEWNDSKAQKFSHSDLSVADDPVFTYTFESTGSEMWFAFGDDEAIEAVGENVWNKLFGTTGDSKDLSGTFDYRYNLDGDHSFCVDGSAKFYRFTVNMAKFTYEIKPINFAEYIWQAGNGNGWGSPASPLYGPAFDGKYTGYMYLDGEFKFRSGEDNWDAPDWGTGGSEGTLAEQAGNLSAATGYYKVDVDLAAMTYALTPITTIGVIGPGQPGGWESDTDMTFNKETGAWEVTIALAADQIKFRANDGWDINWGGSFDNLVQNGDNLNIAEAGTYFIQLFAYCDTKAHAVITKQ